MRSCAISRKSNHSFTAQASRTLRTFLDSPSADAVKDRPVVTFDTWLTLQLDTHELILPILAPSRDELK